MTDDRDLRERFAAQRDADRAGAPAFTAVMAAAKARVVPMPRRVRLIAWSAAAVAAVAAGIAIAVIVDRPAPPPVALPQSISDWTSPTDALLRPPVMSTTIAKPALGSVLDEAFPLPVSYTRGPK